MSTERYHATFAAFLLLSGGLDLHISLYPLTINKDRQPLSSRVIHYKKALC